MWHSFDAPARGIKRHHKIIVTLLSTIAALATIWWPHATGANAVIIFVVNLVWIWS